MAASSKLVPVALSSCRLGWVWIGMEAEVLRFSFASLFPCWYCSFQFGRWLVWVDSKDVAGHHNDVSSLACHFLAISRLYLSAVDNIELYEASFQVVVRSRC